jgi:hypothetical protein
MKKYIPVSLDTHEKLKEYALSKGYTIQGLAERIFRFWLNNKDFFAHDIASSNKYSKDNDFNDNYSKN